METATTRATNPEDLRGPSDPPQAIEVVVLSSRACHLCEDALQALELFTDEFPIRVREIEMDSDEGRELVRIHRPAMPPAILVDSELLGVGRLSRKKLRKRLEATG